MKNSYRLPSSTTLESRDILSVSQSHTSSLDCVPPIFLMQVLWEIWLKEAKMAIYTWAIYLMTLFYGCWKKIDVTLPHVTDEVFLIPTLYKLWHTHLHVHSLQYGVGTRIIYTSRSRTLTSTTFSSTTSLAPLAALNRIALHERKRREPRVKPEDEYIRREGNEGRWEAVQGDIVTPPPEERTLITIHRLEKCAIMSIIK